MRVNIQRYNQKDMAKLLVDIPDDLHKRIKHHAIEGDISIKDMVTEILDENIPQYQSKNQSNIDKIMGKKKN